MATSKRKVGRPRGSGQNYTIAVRAYENEEGMALLSEMAQQRGLSVAAFLRQLVREEARRMGLWSSDWARAAERMREHYESSPEVAQWEGVEGDIIEPSAETPGQPEKVQKPEPEPKAA